MAFPCTITAIRWEGSIRVYTVLDAKGVAWDIYIVIANNGRSIYFNNCKKLNFHTKYVHLAFESATSAYTPSEAFDVVVLLIKNGDNVILVTDDTNEYHYLNFATSDYSSLSFVMNYGTNTTEVIWDADSITVERHVNTIVSIAKSDTGKYQSSRTPAQIADVFDGTNVVAVFNNIIARPSLITSDTACFVATEVNADGLFGNFCIVIDGDGTANIVEKTSIVLTSSTEGSSKRFLLTVDDDGALHTTEITT